jgi:hypothetical protein
VEEKLGNWWLQWVMRRIQGRKERNENEKNSNIDYTG